MGAIRNAVEQHGLTVPCGQSDCELCRSEAFVAWGTDHNRRDEPDFKRRWEERQKEHSESYTTVSYKRRGKKFTKRKYFTGTLNACLWSACPICSPTDESGDYDSRFVDQLSQDQDEDAAILARKGDGTRATGYPDSDLVKLWVLELSKELLLRQARNRTPEESEALRTQAAKDQRKVLRKLYDE